MSANWVWDSADFERLLAALGNYAGPRPSPLEALFAVATDEDSE